MDIQPRHTPGYTGHQPTFQDRVGETFGRSSHNIFQDDTAPRARRVSDSSLDFSFGAASTPVRRAAPASSTPFSQRINRLNLSDVSSPGDVDRRGAHHLPGYGGHVPTQRASIGETYGSTTFTVLRDDSLPSARRLSDFSPVPTRDIERTRSEVHLPGYGGHVPTARDRVGETFGDTTYTVLRDTSLPRGRRLSDSAVFVRDVEEGIHGRTPGYAGHVPSLRERVGATYQQDTADLIRDPDALQGRRLSQVSIANTSIQECPHEPCYTAGYSGHTPGLQDRVGETFGRATHELMIDESNLVRRRMSDITPGKKVIVNRQETSITTIEEPSSKGVGVPEPYYVPGYTGFAPQLQFRIGETYGRATHELLVDPTVDHARQLALSDRGADDVEVITQTDTQSTTVQGRHPISKRPVIPGYDAFVARMRGKRGQKFAINVRHTNTVQEITKRPRSTTTRQLNGTEYGMPLQQVTPAFRHRWPAYEERVETSPKSPYFMEVTNPNKRFMTGYEGHLPFRNDHIGLHNASFTNSALYDFTSNYRRRQSTEWAPVDVVRPDPPLYKNRFEIYQTNTPMVPHYTGHVPGSKFRSGLTYGNDTRDAFRGMRGDRY